MTPYQPSPPLIAELRDEWNALAKSDERWRQLVQHLFTLNEQAENSRVVLEDEVARLKKHEKYDRAEIKELEQDKKALQERLDTAPFVIVLVDGDITLFLEDFVKQGYRGGHDAAHLLQDRLKEYFKDACEWKHHWQIVVRIFANFAGLSKAYHDAGVVSATRTVSDFFVGFNREFPLFEFVDAGSDKEAADRKIQENFKLYHSIAQCKHVLLTSSGDRGYVAFLRPYSADTTRLGLLKALPFSPDFRALAENFKVQEFKDIFKVDKLTPSVRELPAAAHTGLVNYATAAWKSASIEEPLRASTNTTQTPVTQKPMWQNGRGQRIDEQSGWDNDRVHTLMPERLCLKFFLSHCEKTKDECKHEHVYKNSSKLGEADKKALSRLARYRSCWRGLYCEERNCLEGHECSYGDRCDRGSDCKFGQEMHGVDKKGIHLV